MRSTFLGREPDDVEEEQLLQQFDETIERAIQRLRDIRVRAEKANHRNVVTDTTLLITTLSREQG